MCAELKEKHDFLKWHLGNELIDRCFESSRLKLKKMKGADKLYEIHTHWI